MNKHNNIVAQQYDIIYKSFDTSRVRIWNNVKKFLDVTTSSKTLLDCGCGNGKNMVYANTQGYICEGFDISNNLLDICNEKKLTVFYSDVLNFKTNKKYDKIIAIAVLHHLETVQEQFLAIENLIKCLKNNGKLLVSFWSKEKFFNDLNNNKSDSRDFVVGANYVDWKLDKSTIIKRYYYIHDYRSVSELAKSFNIDYNISWEMQNWFITFTKNDI